MRIGLEQAMIYEAAQQRRAKTCAFCAETIMVLAEREQWFPVASGEVGV